jgi:hypothetical protein
MIRKSPLSWFYKLELPVQVALLAHPHGYVSEDVAVAIPRRTESVRHDERPQVRRRWHLRSAEANHLEDERLRLDRWWKHLPHGTRQALVRHRSFEVPARYRDVIVELDPDGVPPNPSVETPFMLTGIAAAYIEMQAEGADPR